MVGTCTDVFRPFGLDHKINFTFSPGSFGIHAVIFNTKPKATKHKA